MKTPSLLTRNFPLLGAKFSFLLAIPFVLGPASVPTHSTADAPFTFGNTGSLNTARSSQTATLLPSGMVLVAGGFDSSGSRVRERGTVRPGEWNLECHWQPQHRTLFSHGDLAAQRYGAGGRWT